MMYRHVNFNFWVTILILVIIELECLNLVLFDPDLLIETTVLMYFRNGLQNVILKDSVSLTLTWLQKCWLVSEGRFLFEFNLTFRVDVCVYEA